MLKYGQIIEPVQKTNKQSVNKVYKAFSEYFDNPVMAKIKDVEKYSMYMVRIHSMLGNAQRYLIVFVLQDIRGKGDKDSLENLQWCSLQTRTLSETHRIHSHSYSATIKPPLDQKITLTHQDEDQSNYTADLFPITITLLHTKKNNTYQYQPTGTIINALETYQTVINLDD